MANADGACLPRERRTTRRSVRTRCTNTVQKKASNSRITRQDFAPDTCKHNRITQVCTSTKRRSVKANPNPRQEQSLVLSGRKNKEEISNGIKSDKTFTIIEIETIFINECNFVEFNHFSNSFLFEIAVRQWARSISRNVSNANTVAMEYVNGQIHLREK